MGRKTMWHVMAAGAGLSLTLALTLGSTRAQMQPLGAEAALAVMGTAFTYQGRLTSGGAPVNGVCDFQFSLWDAASGGTQIGTTQTHTGVGVTAGYFTVSTLDFGTGAFNGEARWLAIAVRCPTGSGFYIALSPRQALTATPYAHSLRPGAIISGTLASNSILFVRNTAGTGSSSGVYGRSDSPSGRGVAGWASATSGLTYGVFGRSDSNSGTGVYGYASATSGWTNGVHGWSDSNDGTGVYGHASATSGWTNGVYGWSESTNGTGVYGWTSANSGLTYGVFGRSNSIGGTGVYGYASATSGTTYGVYGEVNNSTGYAGYFLGRVQVTGNLSKGGGSFKIDHPLDPANKYLYHSFVESPDMKNIYDGVVMLDAAGRATVTLPDWFEALNTDFRYQLTPIGAAMPGLFVAEEISANRFRIAGGVPGGKVSWQVTGIRQDAYARMNRIPVEEDKPVEEKGTYLHPQAFGQPPEKGLDYQRNAAFRQAHPESPATGGDR